MMDNFLPPPSGVLVVDFDTGLTHVDMPKGVQFQVIDTGAISDSNIQIGDVPPRPTPPPAPKPKPDCK